MTARGTKKKPELLSPTGVQNLQEEKREIDATIREVESGVGDGRIDVGKLKGESRRLEDEIHERTPAKTTGITKDRLVKEESELEDKIAEGMPTRYEMQQPTKNPGVVRKHMEWCKRNQANIERYVQIQRTIRPFEPKSIEVLRKEK